MSELKLCRKCGKHAIIESWSSGGTMYMAKCGNPNCEIGQKITYAKGHNLPQVIRVWNLIQEEEKI